VSAALQPKSAAWLNQVQEDIIDPQRRIIDPHHHLWSEALMFGRYELADLWADTSSGHNIEKTVFIDCHANYRVDGPGRMKPIGETEYVAGVAAASREDPDQATIAAIVSHANLLLGDSVEEVLLAHEAAGNGLFRGIRHAGPFDDSGSLVNAGGGRPCPV
jgi:predicted TIM-barrel fold metal-dependent hydrolase